MILGIDPGAAGGAALLADLGGRWALIACWGWRRSTLRRVRGFRVSLEVGGVRAVDAAWRPSLYAVGQEIAALVPPGVALVAEGLFVGRFGGRTALTLGEGCGALLGPVAARCGPPKARPLASSWRPAVLGCSGRTSSDAAEALAVARVGRMAARGSLAADPHVAEAACLAVWLGEGGR